MTNLGYFIIPRSVSSDPRYKSARLKYQKVLLTILENAAFSKTKYAIGTHLIEIEIGQLCISIRGLVDLCNQDVKFKEDLVDKNVVERASHFFRECGFVRQEVRHGKILLTVTIPEFYERKKKESETPSETLVRLNRDTKEERKERKEIKETYVVSKKVEPASFDSRSSLLNQEELEGIFAFIAHRRLDIKHGTVPRWAEKYSFKDLIETLKYCADMHLKDNKANIEAYIESCLKRKIMTSKFNVSKNKELVEDFKSKKRMWGLHITEKYATDNRSQKDFQFKQGTEQLLRQLQECYENFYANAG